MKKVIVGAGICVMMINQPAIAAAKTIFASSCYGCHGPGLGAALKAPEIGDKAAWTPRIAKGIEALYSAAINGSPTNPVMMPRGGSALSDDALKDVVDYMVEQSR